MIDTLWVANFLENKINDNSLNKEFRLFADEGDLIKATKEHNYEQGLVELVSSTVVPIKNINFETLNLQIMFYVDLAKLGWDKEGSNNRLQSQNLLEVKQCIGELFTSLNGQTMAVELGGKTYNVTITMGSLTDGEKGALGEIYEGLPIYLTMSMVFFENGVSANDVNLYINGENIYFTRAVITKLKTADQSTFINSKQSKTLALVGGKSIDFTMPVLNIGVSQLIMEDILDDTKLNRAINVRIETPLANTEFIGILGNTSCSLEVGATAGYNISLVQGVEEVLVYDDNWQVSKVTTESVTKNLTDKGTIYWGDGVVENCSQAGTYTHTYTDGKSSHTIRIFGGV